MKYEDKTSYKFSDTERIPTTLRCQLSNKCSFMVHRHVYYPGTWLLTARFLDVDKYDLLTDDVEVAKQKAERIVTKLTRELKEQLDTALCVLDADKEG